MKVRHFDVVVVGGGPAGSSASYAASMGGASVAMLEREEEIAESVRTSGVTWMEDVRSFGIPSNCYNPIKNYSFCSPNNTVTTRGAVPMAAVLDVRKTYRWLADQAKKSGTEIFLGTTVTGVLREGGRAAGVVAGVGEARREFRAKVVIDASGFQSVVSRGMGLTSRWKRFGVGAEYEARAEGADSDTWWLMVGQKYSPAGYAWIFPLGGEMVRIGVGVGRPESYEDPARLLDDLLDKRPGPLGGLGRITPTELHYGLIPNDGLSRKTIHDNLILVGDAAGHANPLVLEGIRYAIRFGRVAGRVASDAVMKGDTSEKSLATYEKEWRRSIQSRIESASRVQRRWIGLADEQWDRELEIIRELNAEELVDFIKAEFGLAGMTRFAARHPKLAARQLFEIVRGVVGGG